MRLWRYQLSSAILSNTYIKGFIEGKIYSGKLKNVCVPGLNCYACPSATFSCPLGALQNTLGSSLKNFAFYALGFILMFGVIFGRFICGALCPFGFLQDLLYKIKTKKFILPKFFRILKYIILIVFVIIMPLFFVNLIGNGDPAFCKYICPVGTLQGGIYFVNRYEFLKHQIGALFYTKMAMLIGTLLLSIASFRPFCKYICPLGLMYGLMNRVSMYKIKFNKHKCISCQKCVKVCKMQVNPTKSPNSIECIRCLDCIHICPVNALSKENALGFIKKQNHATCNKCNDICMQ